eukprot:1530438-Amphidinium_carterae.1
MHVIHFQPVPKQYPKAIKTHNKPPWAIDLGLTIVFSWLDDVMFHEGMFLHMAGLVDEVHVGTN